MPYYKQEDYADFVNDMDADELQEMLDAGHVPPPGETLPVEYVDAAAAFQPSDLMPENVVLLEAFRTAGFSVLHCRYDGGNDEGFAYVDAAGRPDGAIVPKAAMIEQLAATGVADRLPLPDYSTPDWVKELPEEDRARQEEQIAEARERTLAEPPTKRIADILWDLASELATPLLGEGFGTGEYVMRGLFTVDLTTGAVVDQRPIGETLRDEWNAIPVGEDPAASPNTSP